jgi:hypothetical protein
MRSLLLIESLDLRPSNQYIFLSESPSCLRLEEMCDFEVYSLFWGMAPCSIEIISSGNHLLRSQNEEEGRFYRNVAKYLADYMQ